MFTGKGGVGKPTTAAATALHCAPLGQTLAISTDATSSLSHILEADSRHKPAMVRE
jgi:arsenite-transporting ATPase